MWYEHDVFYAVFTLNNKHPEQPMRYVQKK